MEPPPPLMEFPLINIPAALILPPTFKLPPIPAPPATTKAPELVLLETLLEAAVIT